VHWGRLIELLDQAGPVFKPPLTARADRQMSRAPRQQQLSNIECEYADFVCGVASEILLLECRPRRPPPAEFSLSLPKHVLEFDLAHCNHNVLLTRIFTEYEGLRAASGDADALMKGLSDPADLEPVWL
jgi:hypothetical protein